MSLWALKVILTPLLVAAATLAARRWGLMMGGWLAGLPLISGPISIFLALEQGPAFAAQAAHGALLGLLAVVAFCVIYACSATKLAWPASLMSALGVYLLTAWGLSLVTSSLVLSSVSVVLLVGVAYRTISVPVARPFLVAAPWWDLPVRMATATAMVLLITNGAEYLGPKWSGLLSPFPVFACVMAVFSQIQGGAMAVHRLLRGMIIGCLGAASFLVVVGLAVERSGLVLVYVLAASIAVVVNGASLVALIEFSPQSTRI
jgi:hypothetical protein